MLRPSSAVSLASLASLLSLLSAGLVACGARVEDPTPSPTGGSSTTVTTPHTSETDPPPPSPAPSNPTEPAGGNCTYKDIAGTATVVSLESSVDDTTIGVCHRATTKVSFTFAADDPSADTKGGAGTLTTGDGESFPTSCIASAGLKVGATFAITRRVEISGTCSPTVYEIPTTSPVYACECVPCDGTGAGGCF